MRSWNYLQGRGKIYLNEYFSNVLDKLHMLWKKNYLRSSTIKKKTSNGYETIQDFYLSWALRYSASIFENVHSLPHRYSRSICCALLTARTASGQLSLERPADDFTVKKVKMHRQQKYYDDGNMHIISIVCVCRL